MCRVYLSCNFIQRKLFNSTTLLVVFISTNFNLPVCAQNNSNTNGNHNINYDNQYYNSTISNSSKSNNSQAITNLKQLFQIFQEIPLPETDFQQNNSFQNSQNILTNSTNEILNSTTINKNLKQANEDNSLLSKEICTNFSQDSAESMIVGKKGMWLDLLNNFCKIQTIDDMQNLTDSTISTCCGMINSMINGACTQYSCHQQNGNPQISVLNVSSRTRIMLWNLICDLDENQKLAQQIIKSTQDNNCVVKTALDFVMKREVFTEGGTELPQINIQYDGQQINVQMNFEFNIMDNQSDTYLSYQQQQQQQQLTPNQSSTQILQNLTGQYSQRDQYIQDTYIISQDIIRDTPPIPQLPYTYINPVPPQNPPQNNLANQINQSSLQPIVATNDMYEAIPQFPQLQQSYETFASAIQELQLQNQFYTFFMPSDTALQNSLKFGFISSSDDFDSIFLFHVVKMDIELNQSFQQINETATLLSDRVDIVQFNSNGQSFLQVIGCCSDDNKGNTTYFQQFSNGNLYILDTVLLPEYIARTVFTK